MLPIMFIAPETVPAYRPPTSIVPAHAAGITKSLKKPANPSTTIARTGSEIPVKMKMHAEAPTNPVTATIRRAVATLPDIRANRGIAVAETRQPTPPRSSGRPASSAPIRRLVPRASRR